jgi:hypothetical protein
LGGVGYESLVQSTIIPVLGGLLQLFSLSVFVFLIISLKTCGRTTAEQACFVLYLTTFSVGKPSHLKIFELLTT